MQTECLITPRVIELSQKNKAAKTVSQSAYPVVNDKKLKLLYRLITDNGWYQVLVFTKTKRRAQSLSQQLAKKGITADSLHGDKSQGGRTRALNNFKTGKIQALVATDIAARGIDINQLDCVINFQLPQSPEDYIHRIGRTGRAGLEGTAVSLISSEDMEQFRNIEKHMNKKIKIMILDDFVSESLKAEVEKNERISKGIRKHPSGKSAQSPGFRKGGRRAAAKQEGEIPGRKRSDADRRKAGRSSGITGTDSFRGGRTPSAGRSSGFSGREKRAVNNSSAVY